MKTMLLAMMVLFGACATDDAAPYGQDDDGVTSPDGHDDNVVVPDELNASAHDLVIAGDGSGAKTNTQCIWVMTDCFLSADDDWTRNRNCTLDCGAPSVCHLYWAPGPFICKYDSCYYTNPEFSSTRPCEQFGAVTCGGTTSLRGRCEISSGTP